MRHLLIGALILLLLPDSAGAEEFAKTRLLIHGDVAIPREPPLFRDGQTLGLGGGIGIGRRPVRPLLILAQFDFLSFGLSDEARNALNVDPSSDFGGGEASIFYLWAGGRWNFVKLPRTWPYLIGGVGYMRFTREDIIIDGDPREFPKQSAVGANVGLGIDLALGPFIDFFLEVDYVVGFPDGENIVYVPIRLGLVLDLGLDL
jgi:hypothetical protein